jgi:hypothetical protein
MAQRRQGKQPDFDERTRLPEGATLAEDVLQEASNELINPERPRANVVGFGHGVKQRNNEFTGEPALLVFVEQKLDVPDADLVPEQIAGIQTDVVDTGPVFAEQLRTEEISRTFVRPQPDGVFVEPDQLRRPQRALLRFHDQVPTDGMVQTSQALEVDVQVLRNRVRPVEGGYSIGHFAITAGTMATAVYDQLPGATANPPRSGIGIPRRFYCLSNNHVLANSNNAQPGDPIVQPGPFDGGTVPQDVVARLDRFVVIQFEPPLPRNQHRNLVDAAVGVGEFDTLDREIYWQGYVRGWYPAARLRVGDTVKKTGRTTNHTIGQVLATQATIDVNYGGNPLRLARFSNQIVTTNMSAGGDSGSLVLSMRDGSQPATEDNFAVGLLFAGSPQVTILNHFEFVRALLRIEVHP